MRETVGIEYDRELAPDDLAGSRAHVAMLAKVGLISGEEKDALLVALHMKGETVDACMAQGIGAFAGLERVGGGAWLSEVGDGGYFPLLAREGSGAGRVRGAGVEFRRCGCKAEPHGHDQRGGHQVTDGETHEGQSHSRTPVKPRRYFTRANPGFDVTRYPTASIVRLVHNSPLAPEGIHSGSGGSGATGSQGWRAARRYFSPIAAR